MMGHLERANYLAVSPFKSAAAREHVAVTDTRDTYWFLYVDDIAIGFCGLLQLRAGGRIKGVWVKPDHRGKGHGQAMTLALIAYATDELLWPRLEVFAGNPAFYERMKWQRIGALPNGAVKLARNF